MQGTETSATGLIRFYSKDEVRRYLRSLIEQYQAQDQKFGDSLGGLLRTLEQEKLAAREKAKDNKNKPQNNSKAQARGWVKMGTMMVNTSDPSGAMAEVLFQLHEEVKLRLARTTDALKSYEELGNTVIPEAGLYYLQVRNGVPERIVVDLTSTKRPPFNFVADFQLV
jgi:hypothetical protein